MKKLVTCMLCAALACGTAGAVTFTASAEGETADEAVISALDITSSYPTDSDWANVSAQTMSGENTLGGSVKFATIGSRLCILVTANDATSFLGKDRIAIYATVGEAVVIDCQGHYENNGGEVVWLTNLASSDHAFCTYDTEAQQYRYEFARDLGSNYAAGAQISVNVTHNDAQTEDVSWGAGAAMTYSATMRFEGTPLPVAPDKIVAVQGTGSEGHPSDEEWAQAKSYAMTGANEGTLQVLTADTRLYVRASVKDTTNGISGNSCNDKMEYSITANGKTHWEQGHWNGWLNNDSIQFGNLVQVEQRYDETYGGYIGTFGVNLGSDYAKGAEVTVGFKTWDAGTDGAWGSGDATTIEKTLLLDEYVAPEGVVPGPENVDLHVVITDLAKMPTAQDWANATAYDLIPVWGDTTGATGTVKIYTAAQNLFIRLEVNDPTSCISNDGIYVYFGTEESHLEGRGNYTGWFPLISGETFGQPSLLQASTTSASKEGDGTWTEGVYTYDIGYYIPTLYGAGNSIRICVKHRDSRSGAETWKDGDYTHTIYFDQTVTFGEVADTTVRPQEATEGFTGSSAEIHYNKANVTWNEWTGADSYKLYVYKVNAQGSAEPYTHVSIEGPVYAGEGSYSETLEGLSASTAYAVQLVAYDDGNAPIAYSSLIAFSTISREEDVEDLGENPGEDPGENPGENPGGEDKKKSGCGSVVFAGGAWAVASLAVAAAALVIAKKKKD